MLAHSMRVAALLLAAGRGERLGSDLPKAFVEVAGAPILAHALRALARCSEIEWIQPVLPREELARYAALARELAGIRGLLPAVAGGAERQDSCAAGLAALPREVELVAVHDAARPFVAQSAVRRVIDAAVRTGAALLALPVGDTLKRARGERVLETIDRGDVWAAQTPQVFRSEVLREALAKARAEGFTGTDDAQLVERLGLPIAIVAGDPENWKITRPADLARAEARLRAAEGA
jgi:2-C-methyl-D-erythritol 4-phosphate cytidylyltransferase